MVNGRMVVAFTDKTPTLIVDGCKSAHMKYPGWVELELDSESVGISANTIAWYQVPLNARFVEFQPSHAD
jgi:hypothetical protein